jgi:hypothetical protein
LLLDEHGFGYDGPNAARRGEPNDGHENMQQKDGQLTHREIVTRSRNSRKGARISISPCTGAPSARRVPENTIAGVCMTLNPYCHAESPFQTSFNGLASYVIPRIDVLISVYRDRPILNGTPNNASTDQLTGSMLANLTFTATDAFGTAVAQQIGRPLTGGPFTNVTGTLYGGGSTSTT